MNLPVGIPLYVVIEEESRDVLISAEDVLGFFDESPEVTFLGIHEMREGKRRTDDAVLEVRDHLGRVIGEYFIGRAVLGGVDALTPEGRPSSVSYHSFGNRCEYREAAEIWRRWAAVAELPKGEWVQQSASFQEAWLHVVQNSWFTVGRRAARYGPDEVVNLDGAQILTPSGFYCALGEAVNGPGGYFGSNLDALADCMSSSCGNGPLAEIVWSDFETSRRSLSDGFVASLMDLLREFRVAVSVRRLS
ncbi:barstar family protein [Streptomyces sp. NPDC014870]|uniref:barstar family protein n=1 Tax=Streptomyces sp. NPDC014870 TaxID=3364925 RepID=UPI0036FF48DB